MAGGGNTNSSPSGKRGTAGRDGWRREYQLLSLGGEAGRGGD
jgi:hypothetical protein